MPVELQIIRASEFVRLGAQGKVDLASSREMLARLASACRKRSIDQALLDVRGVHIGPVPLLQPTELAALVNTFQEVGFTYKQKLAVLYAKDPHRGARLFAFIGTLKGWNVRAFDDFEAAIMWLSSTESGEEATEAANAEPVKVRTQQPIPKPRVDD